MQDSMVLDDVGQTTAYPLDHAQLHSGVTEVPIKDLNNGVFQETAILNTFELTNPTRENNFTLFSKLEEALRIKIWRATDLTPRVLYFSREENTGIFRFTIELVCNYPVPALLHTTRESREAVIGSYRLLMKDTMIYIDLSPLSEDIMYFSDWETYKFYLQHYLIIGWGTRKSAVKNMATFEEVRDGLQHLVIGDIFGKGLQSFWKYTYLRGIKSVGFPEKFSNLFNQSEDDCRPEKEVIEKWAKAWERVRSEMAPEIIRLTEQDSKMLRCGDCGPWLKMVEKTRTVSEKSPEAAAWAMGQEIDMIDEVQDEHMEDKM